MKLTITLVFIGIFAILAFLVVSMPAPPPENCDTPHSKIAAAFSSKNC